MKKLKIAIVDLIGLNYDGNTLKKKGIGGSESAIISIAKELAELDFDVTIINDCDTHENTPGIYDGVSYHPVSDLRKIDFNFDIVISQRTVIPFTPIELFPQVLQAAPRDWPCETFEQLRRPSQLKIIWMQDTFCWGDHILEELVINGHINEIFTLSDWHTTYVTSNIHGPRRNLEVLKSHIFQTRNGINRWIDWVDIKDKDPNLFVYNASVTKGMVPLLENIWPQIQANLPHAKLKIIGGYYKFNNEPLNEAGKTVQRLQELYRNNSNVEFTGIIPQPEIAKILAKATYTIYPSAFPETSGISTLESINYNTPVLSCRFGAMGETATDQASYFIDHMIEPNGLFPHINKDFQVQKFVNMVLGVVGNPYLHQQKQYSCNIVKDISTWDTIALQWKQHFYNIFDVALSEDESTQVDWINYRVHQVFGRKWANVEEITLLDKPSEELTPLASAPVSLAIIDIPGMSYDGSTLTRRGLGGSESAVILIAEQLSKIGFDVTVFNGCDEDDSKPGTYGAVKYRPIPELENERFDVVISSRTIMPFITDPFYDVKLDSARKYPYDMFRTIRENAKLKVFWMHDTFSWGDDTIEDLVTSGAVDEIWCLSDFHYHYVMNCAHGRKRSYEVLQDHMWITRNGIVKYFDEVDVDQKDPDLFIFNANLSKGLDPLLNNVWPQVQQRIPNAKLKVIGGMYKLGAAFGKSSDQQSEFDKIAGPHYNNPSIEFTGVVSQKTVAEISRDATFFIYPAALPETYGISTMESIYARTPLLTCRFGALEETGTDSSYYIDYAVVPNGLYPHINPETQTRKFVDMVVDAHANRALLAQKQSSCEFIDDLIGWDAVAVEWKQHLFKKLGKYLSTSEYKLAQYYNSKYHHITGRKMISDDFWFSPKKEERKIVIVSPFYNAGPYLEKCIHSVAQQDYENYELWLINDASTDNSAAIVIDTISKLPHDIRGKFNIINNETNVGAVANQINFINAYDTPSDTIVMLLDGDDSLVNRNDILSYYNQLHDQYDFTYGSSWSQADNIPLVSQPYPPDILKNKAYRSYKFNWNMPYTHFRTFKIGLAKAVSTDSFKDSDGNWLRAGGDNSTFYNILEQADPARVGVISDIIYNYNDKNPLNDYKVNAVEQNSTAALVLNKGTVLSPSMPVVKKEIPLKKILIAIPTNKNIEVQTFKSIYDLDIPVGYTVDFQFFWGYQVDQVRNLIASWVINNSYDYLFAVDNNIAFPKDTLTRLIARDVDMISGTYIQRVPGSQCVELTRKNHNGEDSYIPYDDIQGKGLVRVDGCGFGCVLIKNHVFNNIPYPHFVSNPKNITEDIYFCNQVTDRGMSIWADTNVKCDYIGPTIFRVE